MQSTQYLVLKGARFVALAWVVLLARGAQAAAPATLQPTPVDAKTYTETFGVDVRLDDGSFVHASLMISNVGLSSGRGICRLQHLVGGKSRLYQHIVAAENWHYDAAANGKAASLTVGPCRMVAEAQGLQLQLPFDEATFALRLDRPAQSIPTPGSPVHKGERFYESSILVPFARVQWRAQEAKKAAVELAGSAFVDHSRSTMLPGDLAYGWLRFRGGPPGCGRLLVVRYVEPAAGNRSPKLAAYLWREGEPAPRALQAPHMQLPAAGAAAEQVKATLFDGNLPLLRVRGKRSLLRAEPFAEQGLLGRMVGALLGKVVTETYAATLQDRQEGTHCPQIEGSLEVDHLGN